MRLQDLQQYLQLNLPIIPLCPPDHAQMSLTHRQECKGPGKAPLLHDWTKRHDSPTKEEVEQWCKKWPTGNVGMILGSTEFYNLVGIDIDGEAGEEHLIKQSKGVLPPTWEFSTAHGRRLIYALPDGAQSKKKAVKTKDGELAFLAQGQQTVMPPSVHHSGYVYQWTNSPEDVELADAPQWLVNAIVIETTEEGEEEAPAKTVTEEDWNRKIGQGERNNHLTKLAGSLIARRNIPKDQIKFLLKSWNEQNCEPPLPDQEIDMMVDNLYASEQLKSTKYETKGDSFRPTPFAKHFIDMEEKRGILWRFHVDRGLFYRCDTTTGPWQAVDEIFVRKGLRDLLMKANPVWDARRFIEESLSGLKEHLAREEDQGMFDLGRTGDRDRIYLQNGVLDWKTLQFGRWVRTMTSTVQLPVSWNIDIDQVKRSREYRVWTETLQQWIPDDMTIRFLQQFVGYCLIPDCSRRTAVFLFGGGSNGKSLFLDIISKLFEGYISFVPLHWLNSRFESAKLIDKLINVCGDIDSTYMEETSLLKGLIAGDPIRAEFKHGKSFHFYPASRLMFSANQLPRSSDRSEGWYGRWKFVEFPRRFDNDPAFKYKLLGTLGTAEGLSAILLWAVEGLRNLFDEGQFVTSEDMRLAERDYRMENDTVMAFEKQLLARAGHKGEDTVLVCNSLYKTYREWCNDGGLKAVSMVEFSRRIESLGYRKGVRTVQGRSAQCFIGVTFVEQDQPGGYEEQYQFEEALRVGGHH